MESKESIKEELQKKAGGEAGSGNSGVITLRLSKDSDDFLDVKAKKTTKISRLRQAWAQNRGMDQNSFRFLFEGQHLHPDKTIGDYNFEDNDQIDVVMQQIGGGGLHL